MTQKERRRNGLYYWPDPIECPICKKKFYPAPMHAYKIGFESQPELVCSYHCMRAYEKDNTIYKLKKLRKEELEFDDYVD